LLIAHNFFLCDSYFNQLNVVIVGHVTVYIMTSRYLIFFLYYTDPAN